MASMQSGVGNRRLASPAAVVLCIAAVVLCLQHLSSPDELISCGKLCQAKNMILRAKQALDNKAAAELMLLRVVFAPLLRPTICRLQEIMVLLGICPRWIGYAHEFLCQTCVLCGLTRPACPMQRLN